MDKDIDNNTVHESQKLKINQMPGEGIIHDIVINENYMMTKMSYI